MELEILSARIANLERIVVALTKWTDFTWKQFYLQRPDDYGGNDATTLRNYALEDKQCQEWSKMAKKPPGTTTRGAKKNIKGGGGAGTANEWVVPAGVDMVPPPTPATSGKRALPTKHYPTRPRVDTVTSLRGKPMVSMHGFFFHCIANGDVSKKRIWTCDQRTKSKCPVRLHTTHEVNNLRLILEIGQHNHDPDLAAGRVKNITNPNINNANRSPLPQIDGHPGLQQQQMCQNVGQHQGGGGGNNMGGGGVNLQGSGLITPSFSSSVMYYPLLHN